MSDHAHHEHHDDDHGLSYHLSKLTVPLAIMAIIIGAVWVDHRLMRPKKPEKKPARLSAPTVGAANPKVDLIFFTDFNALNPNAKYGVRGWQLARRVATAYPNSVRLQVRFHYTTRANATPSAHRMERLLMIARAAYAAHRQGQFWKFVDWALGYDSLLQPPSRRFLMNVRAPLSHERVLEWAHQMHLDTKQFKADMHARRTRRFIESELGLAKALGLKRTNLFLINGREVAVREMTYRELALTIDRELERFAGLTTPRAIAAARFAEIKKRLNNQDQFRSYLNVIVRNRRAERLTIAMPKRLRIPVNPMRDAVEGPQYAPVTLVVFSDFQCGFCARAAIPLHKLQREHGNDLRVVFKHFPLNFHRRAVPAAVAALAAKQQGKFWEFHDALFSSIGSWSSATDNGPFVAIAQRIGLNVETFKRALSNASLAKQIEADVKLGNDLGVRGTPTVVVNGHLMRGVILSELSQLIHQEKRRAKQLIAHGVPLQRVYERLTEGKRKPHRRRPYVRNMKNFKLKRLVPGTRRPSRFILSDQGAPARGPKSAPVVITLFTDLASDHDAKLALPLDAYVNEHKQSVRLVIRHLPNRRKRSAVRAAVAALAAHKQGKYWAYRTTLIANRGKLGKKDFLQYAKDNNLNMTRFEKDVKSDRQLLFRVVGSIRAAAQLKINATPAVLINGKLLQPMGSRLTIDHIKRATHAKVH